MGIEGELIRADDDREDCFRCANCHYHETREDNGKTVSYCHRRERITRWDPELFMCTEYAAGDNLDA